MNNQREIPIFEHKKSKKELRAISYLENDSKKKSRNIHEKKLPTPRFEKNNGKILF